MREHSRTQHKYDPDPPIAGYRRTASPQKAGQLSATSRARLRTMMAESLRLRELALGRAINERTWERMKIADSAVNYMLNNYVIIRKKRIQGISGYTCDNCLTFHFQYINNIGYDLTAHKIHRCPVNAVTQSDISQNRDARRRQLHSESIRWLVGLSKSVFGPRMAVAVRSVNVETLESIDLHAPLIELDSIDSSHWAWRPIREHRMSLNEEGLEKIISNVYGTFAVISINEGEFQGCHLLRATREKTMTKPLSRRT
jgi:hypothetical protein